MQAWGNFFSMKPYSGKFSILFLPCLLPWGADLRRLTSINSLAFNFLLGLANGRQWQVGEKMKVILECIPLLSSLLANSGMTMSLYERPQLLSHDPLHITTGTPHFIMLHFIVLCRYYSFLQSEGVRQPFIRQVYHHRFSNSIYSLCVSGSHFGNCHNISNFLLLLYLLWWSVIRDLWCYFCHCFEYTNYAHIRWWTWVTCLSL